jgi:hypothetical protein
MSIIRLLIILLLEAFVCAACQFDGKVFHIVMCSMFWIYCSLRMGFSFQFSNCLKTANYLNFNSFCWMVFGTLNHNVPQQYFLCYKLTVLRLQFWVHCLLCVVIYLISYLSCGLFSSMRFVWRVLYISFSCHGSDFMCAWVLRIHVAQNIIHNLEKYRFLVLFQAMEM